MGQGRSACLNCAASATSNKMSMTALVASMRKFQDNGLSIFTRLEYKSYVSKEVDFHFYTQSERHIAFGRGVVLNASNF